MNIGEYVRLQDGIHKIKEYEYIPEYENCHCMYLDDNDYGLLFTDKELIKHSKKLIDLIEVGDYVNGHRVFDKTPECIYIEDASNKMAHIPYTIDNISSIVTKEQFESMKYEV